MKDDESLSELKAKSAIGLIFFVSTLITGSTIGYG